MDVNLIYEKFLLSKTISTDSRNITPGCMFFALKGDNFNGNKFALEALAKGATAAVVDEDLFSSSDRRILRVDNVLEALQHLARHHRIKTDVKVLAITGSNGKTTTKELCKAVLSARFKVHATEGNLNNHIGVPVTLLTMKPDCEIAIIEMGANHHGEINALCQIAQPDYGLVTNVGKAHLEGFGGIEGVARAKGELISYLIANGKTVFLNGGNKWLADQEPKGYPHIIRYNAEGGLIATDVSADPYLSLTVKNSINISVKTNLSGGYNAENVLAACAVGLQFGISAENIKDALSCYEPRNNRSQILKTARNTVLMDAYNANPSSMAAALEEFLKNPNKRKILIVGEMREVGSESDKEHALIIEMIKSNEVSDAFFVGKAFEKHAAAAGYHYASSVDQLNEILAGHPPHGFYIMVKGSRSNQLEKVLKYL